MNKIFDMEMFLAGVLTGLAQRHLRQARLIQAEIAERCRRRTPWTWQRKHLVWFLDHCLAGRSEASEHRYLLTARLLARPLETHGFSKAADRLNLRIYQISKNQRLHTGASIAKKCEITAHTEMGYAQRLQSLPCNKSGIFRTPRLAMPDQLRSTKVENFR